MGLVSHVWMFAYPILSESNVTYEKNISVYCNVQSIVGEKTGTMIIMLRVLHAAYLLTHMPSHTYTRNTDTKYYPIPFYFMIRFLIFRSSKGSLYSVCTESLTRVGYLTCCQNFYCTL